MHVFHKDESFYDLFEKLAGHVVKCAEHLRGVAEDFSQAEPRIARIHDEERAAGELRHRALERLNRAFIPPIHAEDVHALLGAPSTPLTLSPSGSGRTTLIPSRRPS